MVKKWSKSEAKKEQKKRLPILKKSLCPEKKLGVFEAMGLSKNAYFQDVFKMAKKLLKMPKNGPKMIQKWFKIAQIA